MRYRYLLSLFALVLSTSSCKRSSDEVWNDTKSASRHMSRGMKALGGKHGESRQVHLASEFAGKKQNDYVAFEDEAKLRVSDDISLKQPKETPGELGSSIPGIDAFQDPTHNPTLARIFDNLHFEYNSSLVKGDSNLKTAHRIADWMKSNPKSYLFIEGHCDERGPAAYNFALGANRANSVRNLLLKEGISPDRIFTISYGKERPLIAGNGEESWSLNRRAQFKIYEK